MNKGKPFTFKTSDHENASLNIYSTITPEMETFEKLSKFKYEDFQFRWNCLVFLIDLYNFFSVGYFLGMMNAPGEIWLGLEIITECIMSIDFLLRVFLTRSSKTNQMWFMHESTNLKHWSFLLLSSIPYSSLFTLSESLDSKALLIWRSLKLLRLFQLSKLIKNMEMVIPESKLQFLETIKSILLIFFVSHYSGMLYLLTLRESGHLPSKNSFNLYIDSILWAQETLTGIVQSTSSIKEQNIEIFSLIIMVVGMILYGFLFIKIFTFLEDLYKEDSLFESQKKSIETWLKSRKISQVLQERVSSYFQICRDSWISSPCPEDLPLSLLSEIAIFRNRDLVSKVKLFELGEPSFVMSVVRALVQEYYLEGDFVIRYGDLASQMYFIKTGLLEVLATDGQSRIALLEDGEYFGEIGILMKTCRTVSVKTVVPCVLAKISKENLLKILENFEEHKEFLLQVARQRMKTCKKEDIDLKYDLVEDNFSSSDSDESGELECPAYYAPAEHELKKWWLRIITVPNSKTQKGIVQFEPLSPFFYVWTGVMLVCFSVYVFIIPYSVAFQPNFTVLVLDGISYAVFVFDVYVNYHSAIINEFRIYVHDRGEIHRNYMDHYFVFDALAIVPADWIYCVLECSSVPNYTLKVLRFFKLARVINLLKTVSKHSGISENLIKISVYIISFCALGHITACFLDRIDTVHDSSNYIEHLYWTFSIFSLSSFGDIGAKTLSSKIVSIFLMVFSKLFYVVLFAECVIFIKEKNGIFISFVKKIKVLQEWVEHSALSPEIKEKINEFYLLEWNKMKGVQDDEILEKLPESLSTDLRLEIFRGLIQSRFFPSEEIGAILGVIRKCKLKNVTKGISIVNRGEIGLEMFFILEGSFSVYSEENLLLKQLGPGSIFGELAILEDNPGLRSATVTAITDSSLASLSVEDYKEVSKSYPDFREKVRKYTREKSIESISEPIHMISLINDEDSINSKSEANGRIFENIEDAPFEKTIISTVYPDTKETSNEIKFKPLALRIFQSNLKDWIYFTVLVWNLSFIPLQVAFEIKYSALLILIEILVVIFYIIISLCNLFILSYEQISSKNSRVFNCIFYLIIAVPVAMIVDLNDLKGSKFLIVFFSYLRLLNFFSIFSFFHELKEKKIFWFLTIQFLEILTVTFLCSHVVACLFITIANGEKSSWVDYALDDSDSTVYITAFYWAFGTLIHMVQGDVVSQSDNEKLFTCFVQIFSVFFFAVLYGGLVEVTSILGSKMRGKFYSSYLFVMKFIEKKHIHRYKGPLNDYFNFIWKSQKGVFDNSIFEGLPESLKVDIFVGKYREVLKNSAIFNFSQSFDLPLLRSMYRLMKFRYSIIGDVILRVDDLTSDLYFVLEGEVTIISIQGDNVIGVLGPGSHFGEVTILFNTPIKTATVVSTKFSLLFYISGLDLEVLLNSFPDWKEDMINFSQQRLIKTFGAKSLYEVSEICESISKVMTSDFQLSRKYTLQSDMLISHKIADAKALVFHDKRLSLNLLHLVLIIYSCFIIPFELSFLTEYPPWMLAMEVFCFVESCVYLFIRMQNELKLKISDIWAYRNALIYDLLAISPFNFILPLSGVRSPRGLIAFIDSIRLFSVFRIHSLLSSLMIYNKKFFLSMTIFETCLYLLIFINGVTCVFHFNYFCSTSDDYLSSLYFSLNIITFTGHTDAFPCSLTLIIQVCLVGFISASSISLFLGLLSLIFSRSHLTEYQLYLDSSKHFKKILKESPPKSLQYRIECYSKFSAALQFKYGETIAKEIFSHLPRNLVNDLLYEKSRHMLKKVPFLKESGSDVLLKRIALKLQVEIYLPQDYLIYKDDIGEEMYFIGIGSVNIISPDNSKIIKSLFQGDFFGEMALINNSKRMCSVVADTLCLVYSLQKKDFYEILQNLPEILAKLKKQSELRSRETTSVSHSGFFPGSEEEEQRKLFNHLKMYSLVSSYYNDYSKTRENSSLLTGMKNIKSATAIESFAKDRSGFKIYKRRPGTRGDGERRNSQTSLGKKLVFDRFSRLKMRWTAGEEVKS